jgi:anthranilate synthase component 1
VTYPKQEEVKNILSQGNYKRIPIRTELNADMLTPLMAVRKLKNVSRHVFMLESAEQNKQWGRYTFLGYDPVLCFTCTDGAVKIKSGTEQSFESDDPDAQIRKIIRENRAPRVNGMPPFVGGLVGYFSYDYIKYSEPKLKSSEPADEENFPDADLMLFDKLIVFDNYRQKIDLIVNIRTDDIGNLLSQRRA